MLLRPRSPSLHLALVALCLLLAPTPTQAEERPTLVGHVTIREPGAWRVPAKALRELGIPSAAHAELRLFGEPITPCPDTGDDLLFRAPRSGGPGSGLTVYELHRLAEPRRPGPAPQREARFDIRKRRLERDRVYGELAAADPALYAAPRLPVWFLAGVSARSPATLTLDPQGAEADTPQTLYAEVYAPHRGVVALHATWGSVDLGVARTESAAGGGVLRWTVPAGAVPQAPQPLRLRNVSPPPPRAPRHDVSNGRGILWVDALVLEGRAAVPSLTCADDARDLTPTPIRARPDPLTQVGNAEYVILAVPPLVPAARKLAAYRKTQGLAAAVVDVADVYNGRYGYGNRSVAAIVKFVDALRARRDAPLRYLVLAGDATYDRTDFGAEVSIPTPMARSMYNGATSADRLYVMETAAAPRATALGRLPFRTAAELDAYVERVIRYETKPPVHESRRMLRFITSEGRFGPLIDGMIMQQFRSILSKDVPPAFDVEVTFASETSPFLWPPPAFNGKVLSGLNDGALFYTYVGHGFADGFDTLRTGGARYPILHMRDAERVKVTGTPPIVMVLACTTAMFDRPKNDGIGEALLKRPDGPVAYWGATRVCHPIYNTWVGQALARRIAQGGDLTRLGDIVEAARRHVEAHPPSGAVGILLRNFAGVKDMNRLMKEGGFMYTLLGDPALRVALPKTDLTIEATVDTAAKTVTAEVKSALPDGTKLIVSLELPRNRSVEKAPTVEAPSDPANFDQIRKTHARMNDWALVRVEGEIRGGRWQGTLPLGERAPKGLLVKAWALGPEDVHQGATVLR